MKQTVMMAVVVAAAMSYVSCSNQKSESKTGVGITLANIDSSFTPGKNFFQFANGSWIKTNPIPNDQTRWGTFYILAENNRKHLHEIAEEMSTKTDLKKGSPEQLVGDFYHSAMDTTTIEKLGATPIKAEMEKIEKISDMNGMLAYVANMQQWGGSPMFGFFAGQDPKNSEVNVPQLYQGGISLPDRDYYSNPDMAKIRGEFVNHMINMFKLYGYDEKTAKHNAEVVMKIETALANASMKRVELRDPYKTYHKVTIADLNNMTPSIKWDDMMKNMNVTGKFDYLILGQPDFLKELQKQITSNSLEDWKIYMKWNLLSFAGNILSNDFVQESFNFNNKTLSGQKEIQSRWKRIVSFTDNLIGDALGKLYVAKYFPPEAKKKADELVSNLMNVYEEHIKNLDWMSDVTKKKAVEKLHAITRKIGYPDKWKDYDGLKISPDSFFQNVVNANQWNYNYIINQVGKPVDRTQWGMTPPTVNAYYNPPNNEIVFPAGILQPPFFNAEADDAVNYGGIGAVIGHELTHGFDDQGRNFDAKGNLTNWWTSEDSIKFVAKAQRIVDQYSGYTVLDTLHVNGSLTLGENIADLGGVTISYDAFKRTAQGKSNDLIDGLTPDQRFFLSYATIWASDVRPEEKKKRIMTDPHSPAIYRVNGTLSNIHPFYNAFNLKEGDQLYRSDTTIAKIW
jgi:putative endopeptidase